MDDQNGAWRCETSTCMMRLMFCSTIFRGEETRLSRVELQTAKTAPATTGSRVRIYAILADRTRHLSNHNYLDINACST